MNQPGTGPHAVAPPPWQKMFLSYTVILIGITLVLTLADLLFDFAPPTSIGLIIASVSAIYPGQVFVQHTRRLMTPRERIGFAIVASLLGLLVSVMYLAAGMTFAGVDFSLEGFRQVTEISSDVRPGVFATVMLLGLLVTTAAIYFFVNMMGKQVLKTLDADS